MAMQYLQYRNEIRTTQLNDIGGTGPAGIKAGQGGLILTQAVSPSSPVGPGPVLVILLSCCLGLLLGVGVAYAWNNRAQRDLTGRE